MQRNPPCQWHPLNSPKSFLKCKEKDILQGHSPISLQILRGREDTKDKPEADLLFHVTEITGQETGVMKDACHLSTWQAERDHSRVQTRPGYMASCCLNINKQAAGTNTKQCDQALVSGSFHCSVPHFLPFFPLPLQPFRGTNLRDIMQEMHLSSPGEENKL